MASPFLVGVASSFQGASYSSGQRVIGILCDGSVLASRQSATGVVTLAISNNPNAVTPTFTDLAQTFAIASSTTIVHDIYIVNNGIATSDVWLAYASNDGTNGANLLLAHATYTANGASWSWSNTATTVSALGVSGFGFPSVIWNGTNLIVVFRDGSGTTRSVQVCWTTTKNGSAGWSAKASIGSSTVMSAHAVPLLRHGTNVGGSGTAGTVLIYCKNTGANTDNLAARFLLDTATDASVANWGAESLHSATAQNIVYSNVCTIDPSTGVVHVAYASSVAGTGGAVGANYTPITISGTTITWGTRTLIDSGTIDKTAIAVDVFGRLYVAVETGTQGTAGVINYRTADSPYTTWSASIATVFATGGDGTPHFPSDYIVTLYVPFIAQRGTVTFNEYFDNTIIAQAGPTIGSGVLPLLWRNRAPEEPAGAGTWLRRFPRIPMLGQFIGVLTRDILQTFITGGPGGNNTMGTRIRWVDSSGNGWELEIDPQYGGLLISPWYQIGGGQVDNQNNGQGGSQTSLATSGPDGNFHTYTQKAGAAFWGSESNPFSFSELAPIGQAVRRSFQGTSPASGVDTNGFSHTAQSHIYPGDPGKLVMRYDDINPSGSAQTLVTPDSWEFAFIGGMTQVNQGNGATSAWIPTNGHYGTVGGSDTSGWPVGLTAGDPDYVWIVPVASTGLSIGMVSVKKESVASLGFSNVQFQYLTNTNRLKIKTQGDLASWPATTTKTIHVIHFFKRNLVQADAISMAADYLNPDASGIITIGTAQGTFFNYDEAIYQFNASSNQVAFTHTFGTPATVTQRWLCHYKIAGWTATKVDTVSIGGTILQEGLDYISYVDQTNQVAYITLLHSIVASSATGNQLNNGSIVITGLSAGNFLTRTASDAISAISDSAVRGTQAFSRTASDTITALSDAAVQFVTLARTASDTIGAISDVAVRGVQSFSRTASDSLGSITDSAVRGIQAFIRTASDSIATPSDTATRITTAPRTASDTLGAISDSALEQKGIARTAADTIGAISDSAVRSAQAFTRTASDTLSALSDATTRLTKAIRTAADTLGALSDSALQQKGIARTASDTLSAISDSAVRGATTASRTASDTLSTISDSAVRAARGLTRTASDVLSAISDSALQGQLVTVFTSFVVYGRSGIVKFMGRTGINKFLGRFGGNKPTGR